LKFTKQLLNNFKKKYCRLLFFALGRCSRLFVVFCAVAWKGRCARV